MPPSTPVSVAEPVAVPGVAGVAVSAISRPAGHFWRQLWRRKTAVLGFTLAAVVLLGALLAPWLAPEDPLAMSPRRFGAPSASAWLGTGYFGGRIDLLLMRGVDVLMAFPTLLLALAVVATFGGNTRNLILAVTLAYIPIFSRVIRGSALSVKQNDFVEASRALGARDGRIILRAILPNVLAPIIVQATFNLSTAIMIEAALSFLGLGVQPT